MFDACSYTTHAFNFAMLRKCDRELLIMIMKFETKKIYQVFYLKSIIICNVLTHNT